MSIQCIHIYMYICLYIPDPFSTPRYLSTRYPQTFPVIPDPATPICSTITSFSSPELPCPSPDLQLVPSSATLYRYRSTSVGPLSVRLSCSVVVLPCVFASVTQTWTLIYLPAFLLLVHLHLPVSSFQVILHLGPSPFAALLQKRDRTN